MSAYKDIVIYCGSAANARLLNMMDTPGIRSVSADTCSEFSENIAKKPSGVVILDEFCTELVLSSLRDHGLSAHTAIIVDNNSSDTVNLATSYNITTFWTYAKLEENFNNFLQNIVLRRGSQTKLAKALKNIKKLALNIAGGVLMLDEDCKISFVNRAAEELLRMSRSKLLEIPFPELFTASPLSQYEQLLKTENLTIENEEFETANGLKLRLNMTFANTFEKRGYSGSVIFFNKVSESTMDAEKELQLLKYHERYHSSQQNMAFKKQMIVLKDELSNIIAGDFIVETYFKPLDVLSGDIYGSINIKDGRYLMYIIDAMGKGLSASVTSLQSSSFVNHSLEFSIIKNDFDLDRTITSFLHYIRDRLMDEEALCAVFALLDTNNNTLSVANYGMPPIYLADRNGDIQTLKPNNLPIMKCLYSKNYETYNLKDTEKILILSDGLIETQTTDGKLYVDYILEHFRDAKTKKDMMSLFSKRVQANDDDLTFFLLHKSKFNLIQGGEISIKSSLEGIQELNEILGTFMDKNGLTEADQGSTEYAFSEIVMNALEHGNIGIDYKEKQELISKGIYDDYIREHLAEGSQASAKKIRFRYSYDKKDKTLYLTIQDEGRGFVPANIFKYHSFDGNLCHVDKESYNGRGIFISDNLVDGLYYNEEGNCAHILKLFRDN